MRALTYQILCSKTTQLIIAPSSAIDINLAHTVAIPPPSRAVQFMDAPASKFTPFEHDPHIGGSVVAYGDHVAAAGRWRVQVSNCSQLYGHVLTATM